MVAGTSKGCMCPGLFGRKAAELPSEPSRGRVMVPSLNRMVSFRTVRPNAASDAKQDSEVPAPTLLRTLSGRVSATDDQKKVRVLWNVDAEEVRGHTTAEEQGDCANEESKTPVSRQCSVHTLDAIDMALDSVTHGAYQDGQRIEYFSVTHQLWMSGTISTEVRLGGCSDPERCICYNVTLTNGQFREDVGLDVLRLPFAPGELVEFSSGQQGRLRLAAAIAADQSSAPSVLGYCVFLEGTIQSFEHIPLLRLKRRFPRGRYVEVYRGSEIGWQMAKVHHTASPDGCKAEILPLPALHGPVTDSADASESSKETRCGASRFGVWTSIPIEVPGDEDAMPEHVPSYLLRLTSISSM